MNYQIFSRGIRLTQAKHRSGGMKRASQTADYEFRVMTHAVQSLKGLKFINNFQVAIKLKSSQLFIHALSDTTHSADRPPQKTGICMLF